MLMGSMAREHEQQQLLPRSACRYQRLRGELAGDGEGEAAVVRSSSVVRARRPLRLRRRSCKAAAGMRWRGSPAAAALGCRKALRLRLVRLVLLLPARRLAAFVAELVRRVAAAVAASAAADCPSIVFSSQWGLPVLSHSASTSRSSRLRALYLERSFSSGSGGSGGGSPC
ncbi:hypothetical protein HU200_052057 [Digitaria exilis]|uniref:Uncharacterized protein n=1 Tax=Digitaria exilis TaxID=1010633 RepID=A0A835APU1_9POAL|nr:hypothetical protein HU200_052057 [Digitaria exilis]